MARVFAPFLLFLIVIHAHYAGLRIENTDRLVLYLIDFITKVNLFLHFAQKYGFCCQRLTEYANPNASKLQYIFRKAHHVPLGQKITESPLKKKAFLCNYK